MKGYKFLTSEMKSKNGNETPWEMGVWKEWSKELEMCNKGFHACKEPRDSLNYIYGDRWVEVEYDGEIVKGNDKFVCSKMRIVKELPLKEIMIKFAIACAKNCLFRFEQKYLDDDRPRKAIEAAENYLENNNAAVAHIAAHIAADAADAAVAHTAAHIAAHIAADAADAAVAHTAAHIAAHIAADAADAAAYTAAYAAAVAHTAAHIAADAAHTAAYAAEKKWQNNKLKNIINSYVDFKI